MFKEDVTHQSTNISKATESQVDALGAAVQRPRPPSEHLSLQVRGRQQTDPAQGEPGGGWRVTGPQADSHEDCREKYVLQENELLSGKGKSSKGRTT